MRNLLALLAAAALTFVSVGWYLGWYQLEQTPSPPGHHQVKIDKIGEDLHEGSKKLQEALDKNRKDDNRPSTEKDDGRKNSQGSKEYPTTPSL